MPNTNQEDDGLPPPGSRWGAGAQSVLPYLTKSLKAKPSSAPEQQAREQARDLRREGNPVFKEWPPSRAA
jgi:hypothetical protein